MRQCHSVEYVVDMAKKLFVMLPSVATRSVDEFSYFYC